MRLAIKFNNAATNDPCAICGIRTDPEVGPELFLDGTFELVCYDCGRTHSPELVAAIEAYRKLNPNRDRPICGGRGQKPRKLVQLAR